MKTLVLLWCCVGLTWLLEVKSQSSTCPVFGNDQTSSVSRSREERIFLNFESPSQCRGNVTSYSYCFYDSTPGDDEDEFTYEALLMVYRRSSSTSDIYTPVPGSIVTLSQSHTVADRYRCLSEQVQIFEIQENDVVGACVKDIGSVSPLYLIGDTNDNSNSFKLYQADTRGFDDCLSTQIQSVDTGHEDFIQRNEFILHVHANIDASASCRVGSNPPATAPRTSNVEGTYLNTDNPVACATENTITSWHYCYYTSPLTAGQTYTMTVAVWRLDTPTNTYRLTAGSARTITLVHVATLAKIFCLEETLGSAESVFVSGGDVIGVVLPSSNPIPVVSSDSSSSSSLMRHPQTANATDLASSEVNTISGSALHLYSNLEFIPVPTTMAPTTTEATTQVSMTTEMITTMQDSATTTEVSMTTMQDSATTEMITTMQDSATTTNQIATTMGLIETTTLDEATTTTEATDITTTEEAIATSKEPVGTTTKEPSTTEAITDTSEAQTPTIEATATTQSSPSASSRETGNQNPATSASSEVATTTLGSSGQEQESAGVTVGDIAAIILSIAVMASIVLALALFIIVYKQRRKKSASLQQTGVDNVMYLAKQEHVNLNVDPYDEVRPYDFIPEDYMHPKLKEAFEDYEEIGDVATYDVPINPKQDYQECLDEVKKGVQPRNRTMSYRAPADSELGLYEELKNLKIPNIAGSSIKIEETLGSGHFGTVHKGSWTVSPGKSVPVAIKTLQASVSMKDKIKFLQEGAIMAQFHHPNVVTLHGIALKDGQRMLVVELLSKGDLQEFLKSLKPDPGQLVNPSTPHMLLEFSQQIALGMNYLSSSAFVHRDLAARNILISESNICKIADFGMSRDLEETDYYISSGGKIPFKWTAPEAIRYKKYSTASDVWSYGCVLYEIWSLGTKPFEGVGNVQVLRTLDEGGRLPPPPGCPKRVYELMMQCWAKAPRDRPGFRDMLLSLLENKSVVLRVPPEDASSHPQAAMLGGPLDAGLGMYTTLQNVYRA